MDRTDQKGTLASVLTLPKYWGIYYEKDQFRSSGQWSIIISYILTTFITLATTVQTLLKNNLI
jgi:hypothetical protein